MRDEAALLLTMRQRRFKRIAVYSTAVIGLLFVLVVLLLAAEQRRTQAETGAVLSAFFSQGVLHDIDKWRAGRTVEIIIQRNPDSRWYSGNESAFYKDDWLAQSARSRVSSLSDAWFAQSSRFTRDSFFVNSLFPTDLSTSLRLPRGTRAVFIDLNNLGTTTSDFEARLPNNLGFFVVSHIGLNLNKTEALFYVDHFCGGLCGGGKYVLMRKVADVWHIVDRHGTWIS